MSTLLESSVFSYYLVLRCMRGLPLDVPGHTPTAVASRFGDAEKRRVVWGAEVFHSTPHTMAAELARIIAKDDVVIFSYGWCPYCRRVTRALDAAGVGYNEVDYDDCDDGEAVRAEISHAQAEVRPRGVREGEVRRRMQRRTGAVDGRSPLAQLRQAHGVDSQRRRRGMS